MTCSFSALHLGRRGDVVELIRTGGGCRRSRAGCWMAMERARTPEVPRPPLPSLEPEQVYRATKSWPAATQVPSFGHPVIAVLAERTPPGAVVQLARRPRLSGALAWAGAGCYDPARNSSDATAILGRCRTT